MVFKTLVNYAINRGPSKFWRVQQYLRFAWHFRGRKRNCYRIGIRYVHKAMSYATKARQLRKKEMRNLFETRLEAAAGEHGMTNKELMEGLARCDIQLDRKVLCDMAIYEPRTFKSLVEVSKRRLEQDGLLGVTSQQASTQGVVTRDML